MRFSHFLGRIEIEGESASGSLRMNLSLVGTASNPVIPSRKQVRLWKRLPVVTLICLGISIFGNEWAWGTIVPLLLSWISHGTPICLLLLFVFAYKVHLGGLPGRVRTGIYLCVTLYLMLLAVGILAWYDASPSPWVYVSLVQAIVCGFIGCRIGQNGEAAYWTLKTIARLSALMSVYEFVTPELEANSSFPAIGIGWPVQLFILFGFCWYVFCALKAQKLTLETILGIAACMLEVFISFHKPLVFAGLGSIFVLVFVWQFGGQERGRGNLRLAVGIVLLAGAAIAAVSVTQGAILDEYRDEFFIKYLHMNPSDPGSVGVDEKTITKFSGGRFDLWQQGIDLFWESPWVGSGLGHTFYAESSAQEVHAHNGYIELLYSLGVVGAILHLMPAWIWFRESILLPGLQRRMVIVGPIAAYIGGILAFNMGGSTIIFFTLLSFIALLMGIALGYSVSVNDSWEMEPTKVMFVAGSPTGWAR